MGQVGREEGMRLLDRREGRILGINIIDLLVLLVILFLAFSFLSKLLTPELTFSGDQMYSVIQAYQKLDSKGFLLEAQVAGKWIADGSDYQVKGIVVETRSGSLALKDENGSVTWVGGSMSYLEDVAATEMVLRPVDNYVTIRYINPRGFSSYRELLEYLQGIKREMRADHLYLDADVSFINTSASSQKVLNDLEGSYLLKYASIVQTGGRESIFRFKLAEVSELEKLDITAERVLIGRQTVVHAGYRERPELDPKYRLASLKELL